MDSRELLDTSVEYRYLFDSQSFETVDEYSPLHRLLHYNDYDQFNFLRPPSSVEDRVLSDITPYSITSRYEQAFTIKWENQSSYTSLDVLDNSNIRKREYENERFDQPISETDKSELFSVLSTLAGMREYETLFVTDDDNILSNRVALEDILSSRGDRPNIVSPEEGAEFSGVCMRADRDYHFYPEADYEFQIHLTPWYHSLDRVLLHYFHPDENLSAVLDRFQSLFISIDQLAEEYFGGVNNDTDIMTRYQFHNAITLLTGICDTLALYIHDQLDSDIDPRHVNLQYGDNRLLTELGEQYPGAEQVVKSNRHLIGLLHVVRNEVVHSSGVISRGPGLQIIGDNKRTAWSSHALSIGNLMGSEQDKFANNYYQLEDEVKDHDPITEWGVIVDGDIDGSFVRDDSWIEPYQFIKKATKELCGFTNTLLKELGVSEREKVKDGVGMISPSTVEFVTKHGLFPLLFEGIHPDSHRQVPFYNE